MPSDESRMDISVVQWKPLDLAAYAQQRKMAGAAYKITILKKVHNYLQNELGVIEFQVIGANGKEAYFLPTLINNRFVTLRGTGDLDSMIKTGQTLRILS